MSVEASLRIAAVQMDANPAPTIDRLEPSMSVLGLYLATDLDVHSLGVPKITMIAQWDPESVIKDSLRGKVGGLGMHIPTVCDRTLAPPGEHLVILQALIPSDAGELSPSVGTQFAEQLLVKAEQVLPDLRNHITFVEGYSDGDPQPYPLHRIGPIYGWAALPQQSGPRRLAQRTPVSGLYLTGHWTRPGHGFWTVVLSGINTARLIFRAGCFG